MTPMAEAPGTKCLKLNYVELPPIFAFKILLAPLDRGRAGAVKVITERPQALGLSVEGDIAPTVRFLEEEAGAGREVGRSRLTLVEIVWVQQL